MKRKRTTPAREVGRPARAVLSRRDADVAAIVRAWRRQTSVRSKGAQGKQGKHRGEGGAGEKTLVGCSGGADSVALVLALASATDRVVVGHVVHDLRPRTETLGDRDFVRDLAERLGLEFAEAGVKVKGRVGKGKSGTRNLEALARRARYEALLEMAGGRGIRFVAVAHHADDQLETVVMSLLRGSGPAGLSGMPERRVLGWHDERRVWLIRPMLGAVIKGGITREVCRRMCERAGIVWRDDATNTDVSRLRAAVRHRVVPVLREIRPSAAERATSAARLSAGVARLVGRIVRECIDAGHDCGSTGGYCVPRMLVAERGEVVVGEAVRRMYAMVVGPDGYDALTARALGPIVRAAMDESPEKRDFRVGAGLVRVKGDELCVYPHREKKP